MRHIIIDGYNFIFQSQELERLADISLRAARDKLLCLLSQYTLTKHVQITVIFDSKHDIGIISREQWPGIKVVFAKPAGENADMAIRELVEKQNNKRNILVVSSDFKDIGRWVKSLGAEVQLCKDFERFLRKTPPNEKEELAEKPTSLSKEELDYWLNQFTAHGE